MIAIGATAGAVAGSFVAETLVRSGVLDGSALLLAPLLPLPASIALTTIADSARPDRRAASTPPRQRRRRGSAAGTAHTWALLTLVHRHPLPARRGGGDPAHPLGQHQRREPALPYRAGSYPPRSLRRGPIIDAEAMKTFVRDGTTAFYGSFFFWVNLCALGLQAFCGLAPAASTAASALILLLLPVDRARWLHAHGVLPDPAGGAGAEDGGELDLLLDQQHGAAGALAADHGGDEVQGQAGGGDLLSCASATGWRR